MAIKQVSLALITCLGISFAANAEVMYSSKGSGYIYEAVDGDTVWMSGVTPAEYGKLKLLSRDPDHFRDQYRSVKMRIFGINTEESEHKDKWRNTAFGKQASNYLASMINKRDASFHCWDIGKYNRPICSVSVDGFGDIGRQMILQGYSDYETGFGYHPFDHQAYQAAGNR